MKSLRLYDRRSNDYLIWKSLVLIKDGRIFIKFYYQNKLQKNK